MALIAKLALNVYKVFFLWEFPSRVTPAVRRAIFSLQDIHIASLSWSTHHFLRVYKSKCYLTWHCTQNDTLVFHPISNLAMLSAFDAPIYSLVNFAFGITNTGWQSTNTEIIMTGRSRRLLRKITPLKIPSSFYLTLQSPKGICQSLGIAKGQDFHRPTLNISSIQFLTRFIILAKPFVFLSIGCFDDT